MTERIKEIQGKILLLYKEVTPFLEEKGIRFIACGGTCLGACREKGFIAGDDDMDLNILPEDGPKLMSILKELPEHLSHKITMPGIHKIVHNNLLFNGKPVFIDFMKLGYVKKINKFENILCLLLTVHWVANTKWIKYGKYNHGGIKWPIRILSFGIPAKFTMGLMRKIMSSGKKKHMAQCEELNIYRRTINDAGIYLNRVKVPFEDTYIYIPVEFNVYLTNNFGDGETPVNGNQDHYK